MCTQWSRQNLQFKESKRKKIYFLHLKKSINKHLSSRVKRFIICFQALRGFTGWEGRTYNKRAPSSGWPRARHSPTPTGFLGTLTTATPARTAWSPTGTGTGSGRTPNASGRNTTSVKKSESVWVAGLLHLSKGVSRSECPEYYICQKK